jgi:hypothetical protein
MNLALYLRSNTPTDSAKERPSVAAAGAIAPVLITELGG